MKKVRITVMKTACYKDLIEQYENPIEHACDMKQGQVFVANGWQKPENFCDSAWDSIPPFVMTLAHGIEQAMQQITPQDCISWFHKAGYYC